MYLAIRRCLCNPTLMDCQHDGHVLIRALACRRYISIMSSMGDPATRLVVDLAAYQPIEEGVNLSIHNVRLQQICPARRRRRFLRRRPAQGDGNPIRKEGILIIGTLATEPLRTPEHRCMHIASS